MSVTRPASAALTILALGLAPGCGGSGPATSGPTVTVTPSTPGSAPTATPTPTPTPTPTSAPTPTPTPAGIAGLPAAAILAKAQTAAKAARSVRVKGAMTDGSERLRLDVRVTRSGGSGAITLDGDTFSAIVIGKTAYLRLSAGFWRQQTRSKAEADAAIALIGGRWIKTRLTGRDLSDLAVFASKTAFYDQLFEPDGRLRKTGPRMVDGVRSIGLRNREATLWVDVVTARPVRLESPGGGTTDALTFTAYDRIAVPKTPPAAQVIDEKVFDR